MNLLSKFFSTSPFTDKYYRYALICIFVPLTWATGAVADTTVSGQISENITWTLSSSPYIVTGNILVNTGYTLTIEPGVTIKFDSDKCIQVDGELIARGTETEEINFTSNQSSPAPGDWGYILFSDTSTDANYDENEVYTDGSILEYCVVEYAGGADVSENGALRLDSAHPFINHCTIRNNSSSGIKAWDLSSILKITNNNIYNNTESSGGGIYASGGTVEITGNTISNNTASIKGGGIYTRYSNLTISDNTISDNTSSGYDYADG